ncbi:MAG: non-canonical purine NTP pyrophosphatase [Bacteroidota bacterium]
MTKKLLAGQSRNYALNTSNPNKLKEFERMFATYDIKLTISKKEIREIVASPISVVVHKASQLPVDTIVEDTSLEVEGAAVGIHVKWLLNHLSSLLGSQVVWTVLLAYRNLNDQVYVYQGKVKGVLVSPRGEGFGFDPCFQPVGSAQTLAESKPDRYNARAQAVLNFVQKNPLTIQKPIRGWQGRWQQG